MPNGYDAMSWVVIPIMGTLPLINGFGDAKWVRCRFSMALVHVAEHPPFIPEVGPTAPSADGIRMGMSDRSQKLHRGNMGKRRISCLVSVSNGYDANGYDVAFQWHWCCHMGTLSLIDGHDAKWIRCHYIIWV
jgi:hypothetical protein